MLKEVTTVLLLSVMAFAKRVGFHEGAQTKNDLSCDTRARTRRLYPSQQRTIISYTTSLASN